MNPDAASEVVPYLTSAALIFYAQKFLKTTPGYAAFVQHVPGAAKWAHRLVALVGSIIAAVGIHWTYAGDVQAGGILTVTIPSLASMGHAIWDVVKVYVLQQWAYETTKPKPWMPEPPAVGTKP